MVVQQGSDRATITDRVSQLAHCSVLVPDLGVYLEKHKRTDAVYCQICGSRRDLALMMLCDKHIAKIPHFLPVTASTGGTG